jgi:hypothetical protein
MHFAIVQNGIMCRFEIRVVSKTSSICSSFYGSRGSLGQRHQFGVITNAKRKQVKPSIPKISEHSWDEDHRI